MVTPVEFLTARYDEREAIARAAIGTAAFQKQTGRWSFEKVADPYGHIPIVFALADGGGKTQAADLSAAWSSEDRGAHIAANDPAYVLADIAAKRAILELHEAVPYYGLDQRGRWLPCTGEPKLWYCGSCQDDDGIINGELPCDTLRILAAPFADHPDYNPAWQL